MARNPKLSQLCKSLGRSRARGGGTIHNTPCKHSFSLKLEPFRAVTVCCCSPMVSPPKGRAAYMACCGTSSVAITRTPLPPQLLSLDFFIHFFFKLLVFGSTGSNWKGSVQNSLHTYIAWLVLARGTSIWMDSSHCLNRAFQNFITASLASHRRKIAQACSRNVTKENEEQWPTSCSHSPPMPGVKWPHRVSYYFSVETSEWKINPEKETITIGSWTWWSKTGSLFSLRKIGGTFRCTLILAK